MSKVQFGYSILYVPDVSQAVDFYERAFGLERRFIDDSGSYGELDTGTTTLAFASFEVAKTNLPAATQPRQSFEPPPPFEVALTTDDVAQTLERAVEAGAKPISPTKVMPWGQTVAYVGDLNGVLIEICTPMA